MSIMSDMRSRQVGSYLVGIGKSTCRSQVPTVNEMENQTDPFENFYPTTNSPALGRLMMLMTTPFSFTVYCTRLL